MVVKFLFILVQIYLVRGDYYTPSEEVGEKLKRYDPRMDPRYPFELGLGHYYQGDIMLAPPEKGRVSIADVYSFHTWPNGVVPYEIGGNFGPKDLQNIREAMKMFRQYTCVRFVPRTDEPLFLTIVNNNTGCFAYIGRQMDNSRNLINLQTPYCTYSVATPIHEMMHSLGFFHEFVRPDRDDWIQINRDALLPELQTDEIYESNFAKLDESVGETYNIPYNYGSVMHYSRSAGAANSNYPVLVNKRPWYGDFGNKNGFDTTDVMAINFRYNCSNRIQRPVVGLFRET